MDPHPDLHLVHSDQAQWAHQKPHSTEFRPISHNSITSQLIPFEINIADEVQLSKIKGIGPVFSKRIIIHTSSYLLQLWAALSIIVSSKIILRCLCLSMDHLYFICGHVFQKIILAFFSANVSIRYGSNFDIIVNLIITIVDLLYNNNTCKVVWVFYHLKWRYEV